MILLNLEGNDLHRLCSINSYYRSLCSDTFWREKIEKDYGKEPLLWVDNPKDAYKRLENFKPEYRLLLNDDNFFLATVAPQIIYRSNVLNILSLDRIEYLLKRDEDVINYITDLHRLNYIYENYGTLPTSLKEAVKRDNVETVTWLMEQGVVPTEEDALISIKNGSERMYDVLDILINDDEEAYKTAALYGRVNILDILYEEGYEIPYDLETDRFNDDVIEWLKDHESEMF